MICEFNIPTGSSQMVNAPCVMLTGCASWKSYPWPKEVVKLLEDGHIVIQIGWTGEQQISDSFVRD